MDLNILSSFLFHPRKSYQEMDEKDIQINVDEIEIKKDPTHSNKIEFGNSIGIPIQKLAKYNQFFHPRYKSTPVLKISLVTSGF